MSRKASSLLLCSCRGDPVPDNSTVRLHRGSYIGHPPCCLVALAFGGRVDALCQSSPRAKSAPHAARSVRQRLRSKRTPRLLRRRTSPLDPQGPCGRPGFAEKQPNNLPNHPRISSLQGMWGSELVSWDDMRARACTPGTFEIVYWCCSLRQLGSAKLPSRSCDIQAPSCVVLQYADKQVAFWGRRSARWLYAAS